MVNKSNKKQNGFVNNKMNLKKLVLIVAILLLVYDCVYWCMVVYTMVYDGV